MSLRDLIVERARKNGPLTFVEYMELALYHPELGYYARASQRSGRAGDFFTSVDVGPLFGRLLAVQFEEMWSLVNRAARGGLGSTLSRLALVTGAYPETCWVRQA